MNHTIEIQPKNFVRIQKPFLSWVEGKTQIIRDIMKYFPSEMNNYHEIYLAGKSVLLALLSYQRVKKISIKGNIYAYDININLINLYKTIQSNVGLFCRYFEKHKDLFISNKDKESYYYRIRDEYNHISDCVEKSALFLLLNKLSYGSVNTELLTNGINTPFEHNEPVKLISKKELENVFDLMKDVKFRCSDFRTLMKKLII